MLNQETLNGIVYSSSLDGDEDIYVMNKHGADIHRLTTISKKGETNRTPEWSPDRQQIAFQSNREGPREIYIITISSGDIRRLTYSNSNCNHPAWSPDASKIIFMSDRGSGASLYEINADGSDEKLISIKEFEGRNFFNPCWIPDGNRIAFMLQGQGDEIDSLWTANPDGTDPLMVGPKDLSIFEFDYSHDGKFIIFDAKISSSSPLGEWDIFLMKSDGTEIRRLTNLKAMSSRPKWLLDGRIVFHTNRFGSRYEQPKSDAALDVWFNWWNQFEICTMDMHGNNVIRLTTNHLRDLHPDG